ncbi:MAG TPA: glycosyltransferase [Nitrospiraceae bacterium]|nr:glycosyltransferase [Nitrospiraceae bacterium]
MPAARPPIRVLNVFPGEGTGSAMIFARKQVAAMRQCNVICESFLLKSRTSLRTLFGEVRRFRERVEWFRPDVVHAQYGTMTAFFAGMVTRTPLIVTFRGSDVNPAPSDWWVRSVAGRCLSHIAALKAARIICVSEALQRRLWWGQERAVIIPSGVDRHIFFPRPQSDTRAELGWKSEERIVLFNGGASPAVKRLDLARDGVREAERLCGSIRLMVLNGHMPQPTVAAMLNGADCLVMTSDWEGSPNIIKEALACNLPIVAVDAGDVRERLGSVYPSHIVPRRASDIGLALAHILQRRGRSNGAAAVKELSLECTAQSIRTLYDLVLSGGDSEIGREQDASPGSETDDWKQPAMESGGIEVKTDA